MSLDLQLLHAGLSPGPKAIEAWKSWYRATELENMPIASYRLMPLVHAHLVEVGYEGPELQRIKGIRRRLWVEGEQRVYKGVPFLRDLQERFGRVVLLKGAPLAALYYRDFGLRAMYDLDVLIDEERALEVIEYLLAAGWKLDIHPTPRCVDAEFLTFRHGAGFRHESGVELDIHWRVSYLGSRPGIDALVRDAIEPFDLKGFRCWTLCATDHLFHTLIHGILYSPSPASRWVADAVWILKSGRPIDFSRIEALSRHYEVELYVEAALNTLRDEFAVAVPSLDFGGVGFWARQEFRRETTDWFASGPHLLVASTLHRYARTGSSFVNLPSLLRYCQFQWDLTTADGAKAKLRRLLGKLGA